MDWAESPGQASQAFWERERTLREQAASAATLFAIGAAFRTEGLVSPLSRWLGPDDAGKYLYAHREWQPEHLWAADVPGTVRVFDGEYPLQSVLAELEVFGHRLPENPVDEVDMLLAQIPDAVASLGSGVQATLSEYLEKRLRAADEDTGSLDRAYSLLLASLPETAHVLAERAFLECFRSPLGDGQRVQAATELLRAALSVPGAPPWLWSHLWAVDPSGAGSHEPRGLDWSETSVLLALAELYRDSIQVHPLEELDDFIAEVHQSDGRQALRRAFRDLARPDEDSVYHLLGPYAGSSIMLWPREVLVLEPEDREPIAAALLPAAAAALRSIAQSDTPPVRLSLYTLGLRVVLRQAEALGNPRILGILSAALASALEAPETLWEHYGPLFFPDSWDDWTEPLVDAAEEVSGWGFYHLPADDQGCALALTRQNEHQESERLWLRAAACLALAGDEALAFGDDAPGRIRGALLGLPGDMFARRTESSSIADLEARLAAFASDVSGQIRELSGRVVPVEPAERGRQLLESALDGTNVALLEQASWLAGYFGRFDGRLLERSEEAARRVELTSACRDRAAAIDELFHLIFPRELLEVDARGGRTRTVSVGEMARYLQEGTWRTSLPARLNAVIEKAFPSHVERVRAGNLLGRFAEARRAPVHQPEGAADVDIGFFVPEVAKSDGGPTVFDLLNVLAATPISRADGVP